MEIVSPSHRVLGTCHHDCPDSCGWQVEVRDGTAVSMRGNPEAQATLERMPADEVQLLYSICLHGRADLGLAPDEYAALTMVLLRLLAFKPTSTKPLQEKKSLTDDVRLLQQALPMAPVVPAAPLVRQGRQLPEP
jgi:DNA polymerase-3 subunit gamma/tau